MSTISQSQIERAILTTCGTVLRNEHYFADLDGLAGDGDFGTSLATGFRQIEKEWDEIPKTDIGAMLLKISMIVSKHVGGSSGPIWGTGFMKAALLTRGKTDITLDQLAAMLGSAIEGIMARGGAKLGDKTLLDALIPVHETLKAHAAAGDTAAALKDAAEVADKAIDETRSLRAGRGRASQVGERSIDTPDPGIVAIATILQDWCKEYGVERTPVAAELAKATVDSDPYGEDPDMKKFVNDPAAFVPEFMKGIAMANPDLLDFNAEFQMVTRKGGPKNGKVSIVQGSGSGHEPAHVMAVGPGLLTGACQGAVFAAPAVDSCYETIKACNSDAGVLVLVNNYQGDRMAWDMATEMANAEGINARQFWINDDVAVEDSLYTVGRRGVAGNFFVIKACGAAAEQGKSLDEVEAIAKKVNDNVRTMGVALTSCIPPAKGTPIFDIGDDEMEVGVGIHGEPGRRREKIKSADEITEELFEAVAKDVPFNSGDRVAIMVNGLGGTPVTELYVLYAKAHELAEKAGFTVVRNYVGEYCTSLEMAGASLTILRLDSELESLLDAPAESAARIF